MGYTEYGAVNPIDPPLGNTTDNDPVTVLVFGVPVVSVSSLNFIVTGFDAEGSFPSSPLRATVRAFELTDAARPTLLKVSPPGPVPLVPELPDVPDPLDPEDPDVPDPIPNVTTAPPVVASSNVTTSFVVSVNVIAFGTMTWSSAPQTWTAQYLFPRLCPTVHAVPAVE
jgi:hypothetical protein